MNETKGLYKKHNVTRTDGKPMKGYFVIEFKDPLAGIVLQKYCDLVAEKNPALAEELVRAFNKERCDMSSADLASWKDATYGG